MSEPLEVTAGRLLRERGATLSVAESCTGGLLGHRLTDAPGSSEYFIGGVIAYAYEVKEMVLGVRHATIWERGAVSPECAAEMAAGVRRLLRTDIGLSITGIAGPGGGTAEKPVGLTYIHLSAQEAEVSECHAWDADRAGNKHLSVGAALHLLVRHLSLPGSQTGIDYEGV